MARDEISLIEELVQLPVKSLLVVLNENPTLICSVWTREPYNPNSFRAKEDLEMIMEGRPWFFRRQLIIFDRLLCLIERSKIQLVSSPFWLKIGLCPPECDKKDFMHAIGSTFGGLIKSEVKGEFCQLRVHLDA
ncbi:hypothetical protein Godav_023896 [Gossypium davidsonii]|uniref:DUF4283 domain-containing protein n=2 Tax=Gossypium TaxID=3633 RepID=A0A7J8SUU8_GOSDV|nr:hypothetical protein [Gossypium davidsonii]MBA0664995.1 hypothetical protein [Gossypium klotzschianum]